jgi:hypothetical protein
MKHELYMGKIFGFLSAAMLAVVLTVDKADAAVLWAEMAAAPVLLDVITAANPAEIGSYEYVYDIMGDNESQFTHFQLISAMGADWNDLTNQNPRDYSGVAGINTQHWDKFSATAGIASWNKPYYGSWNDGGGNWAYDGGYTGEGQGILNNWHTTGEYVGSSGWSGSAPQFIYPGGIRDDGLGHYLNFQNKVTNGTALTGLIMTVRLTHPGTPVAGGTTFRAYSYNGATVYTNDVLGPGSGGPVVPEPSTLALFGAAMLGLCGFIRRRNG